MSLLLLLLGCFSRVRLLATPWTRAYQAPPSMGFSRQEYWSGVPSPSPNMSLGNPIILVNKEVVTEYKDAPIEVESQLEKAYIVQKV